MKDSSMTFSKNLELAWPIASHHPESLHHHNRSVRRMTTYITWRDLLTINTNLRLKKEHVLLKGKDAAEAERTSSAIDGSSKQSRSGKGRVLCYGRQLWSASGRWIVRGTWRQFRQRQFEHQPRNLLVAFRSLYYVKAKIYNLENIYFSSLTLLKLFSDF